MKPNYDTTMARIAGNIAAGMMSTAAAMPRDRHLSDVCALVEETSVDMARRIVARCRALAKTQEAAAVLPIDHELIRTNRVIADEAAR